MSIQEVRKAVNEKALPLAVAEKYLKLYVADTSWQDSISSLWKNSMNKLRSEDLAKEHVKKAISCATLLPMLEKVAIPNPPTNLLFWCTGWTQFNKEDWFSMYMAVLKEDIKISDNRNEIIKMGIIDPIDISPITRQAFNWLYQKAEENEHIDNTNSQSVRDKFANLVKSYGGAVVCNIFMNHKNNIEKVFNWRSGYFFEKQIHSIYSMDQIKRIKQAELSKTNNKYIKKVGV